MRSTDQAIRRCIDSFADDLIDLAEQVIHEQVSRALARIKPLPPPASRRRATAAHAAKAAKAPKVKAEPRASRRKLTPLEKLERAQERKRQRQLALPFNGDGEAPQREPSEAKPVGRRGRRKASESPPQSGQKAKPEAPPAPLFVVKRTRDGSVQALQRKAEGEVLP